jgi:uncharacterized protein with PQ loop repeat
LVEFLGITSVLMISAAYLPQIIKLLRTRSAEGIAVNYWILVFLGLVTGLAYNVIRRDWVMTTSFGNGAVNALFILCCVVKYRKD